MDENMNNKENVEGQQNGGTTQQSSASGSSAGSTGNGSYQYGQENSGEYRSAYSNTYGSNQGSSQSQSTASGSSTGNNASSQSSNAGWNSNTSNANSYSNNNSNSAGSGWNNNNSSNNNSGNWNNDNKKKKKGHGGKVAFAVLLAAIFGVCAGLGGYGISRAANNGSLRSMNEAQADESDDNKDSSSSDSNASSNDSNDTNDSSDSSSSSEDSSSGGTLKLVTGDEINTAVTQVAENVMPSIVSVYNNFTQTSQNIFGQTYQQQGESTGSGIIIGKTDDELLIATNNHVVEDEDSLSVQFIDETTAEANIKGTDASDDLAVIAVSLDDIKSDTLDQIKVATLGDSDALKVGEPVVAIGNALGYGQSVTTGVVSALNREIESQDAETGDQINGTFIQTDAAINPGNSGGALCDLNGNVIGINSSKIGGTTVEGMGYAIPMSKAAPIIEDLMNQSTKTKVSEEDKGYLGITGVSVTSQVASAYNMPQGVYVYAIIDGGGAADSELQQGDIITAIEGSTITTMEDLQKQLEYYAAGDTVTLTVERASGNGEYNEIQIDVKLGDSSTLENAQTEQNSGNSRNGNSRQGSANGSNGSQGSGNGSRSNGNGSSDSSDEDNNGSSSDDNEDDGGYSFYTFPWNQW